MAKAKKDFTANVKNTVSDQIAEATAQLPGQMELKQDGTITEAQEVQEVQKERKDRKTYSAQEALEAQEALHTQGRKGVSAPRINLAFTPSVYEYIKVMAGVRGQTLTEFVNDVLQKSLTENKDIYEQAKAFQAQFK